jgi:hypothetical protein
MGAEGKRETEHWFYGFVFEDGSYFEGTRTLNKAHKHDH